MCVLDKLCPSTSVDWNIEILYDWSRNDVSVGNELYSLPHACVHVCSGSWFCPNYSFSKSAMIRCFSYPPLPPKKLYMYFSSHLDIRKFELTNNMTGDMMMTLHNILCLAVYFTWCTKKCHSILVVWFILTWSHYKRKCYWCEPSINDWSTGKYSGTTCIGNLIVNIKFSQPGGRPSGWLVVASVPLLTLFLHMHTHNTHSLIPGIIFPSGKIGGCFFCYFSPFLLQYVLMNYDELYWFIFLFKVDWLF